MQFGASQDLQIFHDGSDSYITDTGTGNLLIRGSLVAIQNTSGETIAKFEADGASTLNFDGSIKLETTGYGVTVFGTTESQQLSVSGISTFQDDVTFTGTTNHTFTKITRTSNGQALQLINTSNANSAYVDQRFVIDGHARVGLRDRYMEQI